jgi:putative transposase
MPRRARIVVPGCAHHVTQRGNRQSNVFRDDEDHLYYMELLLEQSISHHAWIWTYTLMTNHIHTIAVPQSETALSEVFRDTHAIYGQWFNRKYGLSGHLWQGRFYSCVLDDAHLWAAVKYVERNPVRAHLVARAEDYRWSSARAHVYGDHDLLLDPGLPLTEIIKDWAEWLAAENTADELTAIRVATARDVPLGDKAFIQRLESELGRTLGTLKPGRKSKCHDESSEQGKLTFTD